MVIKSLELADFRNYKELNISFDRGTNILYGDNAQGKTNLIEALYLLTGQKSFRQTKESEFVRFGEKKAQIIAAFSGGSRDQEVSLTLEGGKRSALLNDLPLGVGRPDDSGLLRLTEHLPQKHRLHPAAPPVPHQHLRKRPIPPVPAQHPGHRRAVADEKRLPVPPGGDHKLPLLVKPGCDSPIIPAKLPMDDMASER